ncbi:hypothetical protein B0H19DRAFT_957715, partial [Mycena capillaripes]
MLSSLSAVIHVPATPAGTIQIIHLSFREFMTFKVHKNRPDLLCGTEDQQHAIASSILRVLHNGLQFNICDLPTSYLRNTDMPDLTWRLDKYIPRHLRYASRFWADHLTATTYCSDIAELASELLLNKFLFWLEVLSLLQMLDCAPYVLEKFSQW